MTTNAGRAQHDLAWGDWEREPNSYVNGHTAEREGCPACAAIAAIEAEKEAEVRARLAAEVRGLRRPWDSGWNAALAAVIDLIRGEK